mmetsp:Transcript_24604/g.52484  ORF Transcript_24604/g.52484 Transcript_24604/m.52484 type:complete len:89 (+) Transcript_24604:159-425(+)
MGGALFKCCRDASDDATTNGSSSAFREVSEGSAESFEKELSQTDSGHAEDFAVSIDVTEQIIRLSHQEMPLNKRDSILEQLIRADAVE